MGYQDRPVREFQEHRQHRGDGRGIANHRGGDAGELDDLRWDTALGIDQGGELAEDFATADFDRSDLGDAVKGTVGARLRPSPGGLEVDDDECRITQAKVGRAQRAAETAPGQRAAETAPGQQAGETELRVCPGTGHGDRR